MPAPTVPRPRARVPEHWACSWPGLPTILGNITPSLPLATPCVPLSRRTSAAPQLTHGGDWAGYRAQYGHDALDFSANVSPLGLPQGVANAIAAALPHADRYPDPLCRALRAKLAPHEGIPAESILCGNGAADLIFRLAWAAKPRTALVTGME